MVRVNNIIALVVFLIILCASLAVFFLYKSDVDIIKQTRHYPYREFIYDDYSFKDDRFVYLVYNKYESLLNYTVVQEKFPFKSPLRSCNFSLEVKGKVDPQSIIVAAFGVNDTILMWEDEREHDATYVRMKILDLNSCNVTKIHESRTFSTTFLRNTKTLVPYTHTFDVFYENYDECIYQECQLGISNWNHTGDIFWRVKFYMPNHERHISNINAIGDDVPDQGIVYVKTLEGGDHSELWMNPNNATSNHDPHQERQLLVSSKLASNSTNIKTSVVKGSIGVCSREDINSNITCWQFYSNGTERLSVELDDVNNITHLHNIYSLPEGGFILSFVDYGRCQEDVCDPSILSNYFLMKIDAEGKPAGKLRFQGLDKDCTGIKHAHVYRKSKKEEYCAVVIPVQKQKDKFDILANCFPISNFST